MNEDLPRRTMPQPPLQPADDRPDEAIARTPARIAALGSTGPAWLLAQTLDLDRFDRAMSGRDWPERVAGDARVWLVVAAIGLVAVLILLARRATREAGRRHLAASHRFARGLGLSAEHERTAEALAEALELPNIGPLLLSRGVFLRARRTPWARRHRDLVEALESAVFDAEELAAVDLHAGETADDDPKVDDVAEAPNDDHGRVAA